MTDSGGFSFLNSVARVHEMRSEEYWLPYLHEYVEWLEKFRDHIYVAANLDLDVIVGRDVVDKWNTRLFIDLEKSVNVTYVAHKDKIFRKGAGYPHADPSGLNRVREYAKAFDYIGVSEEMKERHASVYAIAAANNARVHGFAWTSIPLLKMHPMFSVDSTTWLGGVKYGTTYAYDGKNFRVIDYKKKYRRKSHKIRCEDKGLDYDGLIADEGKAVTKFNLESWKGARTEYLRSANSKLRTNTVASYDHRRDY